MKLYLMRHAHALSASESGAATDAERPLSSRGERDAERMARALAAREGKPGRILHSPLRRAVRTAEIAASALAGPAPEAVDELDNARPPEEVAAALRARAAGAASALAVGHQPTLGELAVLLARSPVDFKPGGIAALELGPKPRLLWTLNPEEL